MEIPLIFWLLVIGLFLLAWTNRHSPNEQTLYNEWEEEKQYWINHFKK